jgi:hypothetical protein
MGTSLMSRCLEMTAGIHTDSKGTSWLCFHVFTVFLYGHEKNLGMVLLAAATFSESTSNKSYLMMACV